MSLFPSKTPPAVKQSDPRLPQTPPSIEEVHAGALASAAYATSVFRDAVDELIQSNVDLDDVVLRATSEIDRLSELRDAAISQRRENTATVANIEALLA